MRDISWHNVDYFHLNRIQKSKKERPFYANRNLYHSAFKNSCIQREYNLFGMLKLSKEFQSRKNR